MVDDLLLSGKPGHASRRPRQSHPPTSPAQERTKVHAGAPRPTPEDDAPGSAKAQRPTEPATPAALPGPGPGPAWAPLASTKRRPRTCQRTRPLPTPCLRTPGSLARGVRLQALPVLGASGLGLSGSGADLGRKSVGRRLRPAPAVSSHALPAFRRLLKRVWQGLGGRWARFLFLRQRQGLLAAVITAAAKEESRGLPRIAEEPRRAKESREWRVVGGRPVGPASSETIVRQLKLDEFDLKPTS
ncbi:uncharacterized protein LOC141571255 [Rhinolophus sinicus]|uniref:uncharacterized protein LOC141571255 n=1 Tax=Rhinolophus sinicus TaxID=89399 RepID=UPI003D795713